MSITQYLQSCQPDLRLVSHARALLAVSALAALAVSTRSFAQAPTFNALVATPVNVGDINGDVKLDARIAVVATKTFRGALQLTHQDQS